MEFIKRKTPWKFDIEPGFVPGMNVPGSFYINKDLEELILGELRNIAAQANKEALYQQ